MTHNLAARGFNCLIEPANYSLSYWVGRIVGTPLIEQLMTRLGNGYLHTHALMEGEVSPANAFAAFRSTMHHSMKLTIAQSILEPKDL